MTTATDGTPVLVSEFIDFDDTVLPTVEGIERDIESAIAAERNRLKLEEGEPVPHGTVIPVRLNSYDVTPLIEKPYTILKTFKLRYEMGKWKFAYKQNKEDHSQDHITLTRP